MLKHKQNRKGQYAVLNFFNLCEPFYILYIKKIERMHISNQKDLQKHMVISVREGH